MAYNILSLVMGRRLIPTDNAMTLVRAFTSRNYLKGSDVSETVHNDPLYGIRILDLTRIVAGPYCTMVLGDLGADVVKIERPGTGDECRHWGPFVGTPRESCYFLCLNRNKRSICVDMKSSKGRQILFDLAKSCDVLVENYVPGKLDEMGLGYGSFKDVAPHLIYCSITGFGPDGPYKDRPGYDVIAASMGGLLHITGPTDGEPCKTGVAMTDIMTGLYAHGAIMAALLKRTQTGVGQKIDCNLLSTQISCLINIGANFLMAGIEAKRYGTAHPSIVPYETFKTADGGYLTIGTGSDAQFLSLSSKLNLPSLSKDARFKTNTDRVKNRVILIKLLKDTFLTKSKKEWLNILDGAAFPFGPVNSMAEVFEDPHVCATGLVKEINHPTVGNLKLVGPAVLYSEGGNRVRLPPPLLGQHTEEVLKNIAGYSDEDVKNLRDAHQEPTRTVRLKLRRPKSKKKVQWEAETVDNENLNRKKSKCCCVYRKPKQFDESSSDTDDECEHCKGHVEVKKSHHHKNGDIDPSPGGSDCVDEECPCRRNLPAERLSTPDSSLAESNGTHNPTKQQPGNKNPKIIRSKGPPRSPRPSQRIQRATRKICHNDNCSVRSLQGTNRQTVRRRKPGDKCEPRIVCAISTLRPKIRTVDKQVQTSDSFSGTNADDSQNRVNDNIRDELSFEEEKSFCVRKSVQKRCVRLHCVCL